MSPSDQGVEGLKADVSGAQIKAEVEIVVAPSLERP